MQNQDRIYQAYLSAVAAREKPTAPLPMTDGSLEETLAIAVALTAGHGTLLSKKNLLSEVERQLAAPPAAPKTPHKSHTMNPTDPPDAPLRCITCGAEGDGLGAECAHPHRSA